MELLLLLAGFRGFVINAAVLVEKEKEKEKKKSSLLFLSYWLSFVLFLVGSFPGRDSDI